MYRKFMERQLKHVYVHAIGDVFDKEVCKKTQVGKREVVAVVSFLSVKSRAEPRCNANLVVVGQMRIYQGESTLVEVKPLFMFVLIAPRALKCMQPSAAV